MTDDLHVNEDGSAIMLLLPRSDGKWGGTVFRTHTEPPEVLDNIVGDTKQQVLAAFQQTTRDYWRKHCT